MASAGILSILASVVHIVAYTPGDPVVTGPQGINSVDIDGNRAASCAFDTFQATTYLSQAGTAIDMATRACLASGPQPPTAAYPGSTQCWVDVTTILESFSYATSFMSAAFNQCSLEQQNVQAQCAADVSGLVAAVADTMQASGGMSQDCPDGAAFAGRPKPEVVPIRGIPEKPYGRPIAPSDQTPLERKFGAEVARCAIDALQATWFLGRAGINIDAAVAACPPTNPEEFFVLVGNGECRVSGQRPAEQVFLDSVSNQECERQCKASATCMSYEFGQDPTGRETWCILYGIRATAVERFEGEDIRCFNKIQVRATFCATSVSATVSSFAYVAAYVAGAAGQCSHGLDVKAFCASDVARLVAALSQVASVASSMSESCTGEEQVIVELPTPSPTYPPARRLANDTMFV